MCAENQFTATLGEVEEPSTCVYRVDMHLPLLCSDFPDNMQLQGGTDSALFLLTAVTDGKADLDISGQLAAKEVTIQRMQNCIDALVQSTVGSACSEFTSTSSTTA